MTAESLVQVVELFPGPALVVGPGGEVLGANGRASGWIGPDRGQLAGRPLDQLVADPPGHVAAFLEACSRGDGPVAGALTPARGVGAGGECRVEGIAVRPPCGGGGGGREPALVVVRVLDGAPDAGGSAATADLHAEVRRRDAFIDRLAHDLRNPVAALSGALHLARRASAPEDVAWAHDAMERQLRNLVRQLDDLLELSRLARGKVELDRRRVDAAAVARAAAASARPVFDERGLRLTVSAAPGELAVDADPARLEQLLAGLLGHIAATADPAGPIRLSVAREGGEIAFRVRDRDREAPAAADAPEASLSLGLALARALAERQGGSASFRGEGTGGPREFTVRLPAAAPPAGAGAGAGPAAAPTAATAGARVLVVDDNVDAARGTARLLQFAGYDVRVAHDGREALEVADAYRPRFILLDIGLPGLDGYEVARQLRGHPHHRDAAIIAISGYSADDYRHPHEAGFDHHLVKPVDFDALRAILDRAARGADAEGP